MWIHLLIMMQWEGYFISMVCFPQTQNPRPFLEISSSLNFCHYHLVPLHPFPQQPPHWCPCPTVLFSFFLDPSTLSPPLAIILLSLYESLPIFFVRETQFNGQSRKSLNSTLQKCKGHEKRTKRAGKFYWSGKQKKEVSGKSHEIQITSVVLLTLLCHC